MEYRDVNEALPALMKRVLTEGDEVGSRNGRAKELLFQQVTLTESTRREVLLPSRRASLPAQIAETMWVLAGRDEVAWLRHYLPRADDYSDDGDRWRGAYGPRLRGWSACDPETGIWRSIDQLAHVVELLREDPLTRRAVMTIYDPARDAQDGKDIPCNNWLHFLSRNGRLDLHVVVRSNDLMWGWSGINTFEWSVLQEIVAVLLGLQVGKLHFSISSLHLYQNHWKRAETISREQPLAYAVGSPRFDPGGSRSIAQLDQLVDLWFAYEEEIRTAKLDDPIRKIGDFPEPMLRSWLYAIGYYWTGDTAYLAPSAGTPLYQALLLSPARKVGGEVTYVDAAGDTNFVTRRIPSHTSTTGNSAVTMRIALAEESVAQQEEEPALADWERELLRQQDEDVPTPVTTFHEFVAQLHAEKDAVYGDSWKKRGEAGILGNIARKVDRLGEAGGGDTATDTVVDLLVYLIKYWLWLADEETPDHVGMVADRLKQLESALESVSLQIGDQVEQTTILKELFSTLEEPPGGDVNIPLVAEMIQRAYRLSRYLWTKEQWHAGNATRSWNPEQ